MNLTFVPETMLLSGLSTGVATSGIPINLRHRCSEHNGQCSEEKEGAQLGLSPPWTWAGVSIAGPLSSYAWLFGKF